MTNHDTIIIKAPLGTKAEWVRQSQALGLKLSDWVLIKVGPTKTQQTKPGCCKCLYKHGSDWLDDGDTCPKCLTVN